MLPATMEFELNRLGVVIRAKPAPKPKPATGPIRVVTGEPDF